MPHDFHITYDFDHEDEAPEVWIRDPDGERLCMVDEEPECTNGAFSWNPEDWQPGVWATRLLHLLQTHGLLSQP